MMGFVRVRKLRVMVLGLVILGTSTLAAAQPVRTARIGILGPTPGDAALMEQHADRQGPWPHRPAGDAEAGGQDHPVMGGQRCPLTVTEGRHVRQG